MKNIQSITLVMMVVMVFTKASQNWTLEKHMIDKIIDSVKNLEKELPNNASIMVAEISTTGDGPCVNEFFCLAEKALVNATHSFKNETKETRKTMWVLIRALGAYNKEDRHVHNCTLNPNPKYHLKKFLKDFKHCLKHLKEGM